jgi:hypothetical protein
MHGATIKMYLIFLILISWRQPGCYCGDRIRESESKALFISNQPSLFLKGNSLYGNIGTFFHTFRLLKERYRYVQHNYILLCMVDSNRLHVSTLYAGHLQDFILINRTIPYTIKCSCARRTVIFLLTVHSEHFVMFSVKIYLIAASRVRHLPKPSIRGPYNVLYIRNF